MDVNEPGLLSFHARWKRRQFRMLSAREMRLRVDAGFLHDFRALACRFGFRQSALANGRADQD